MKQSVLERAEQYARRGQVQEAIQLLRKAVLRGRVAVEGYLRLAELCSQVADWRQAVWALRRARELDPRSEPVRKQLVESLIYAGQIEEAVQECQNWLRETPDHPVPLEKLCDAHVQRKCYSEALAVANQLVRLQPLCAHCRVRRARLLVRMGRTYEAIEDYLWVAFESRGATLETLIFAYMELERLNSQQLDILFSLLLYDSAFRLRFLQDPVEAVHARGFRFSPFGEKIVEHLPKAVREILPNKRRYAPYS